jgi:hypothetical protein
MKTMITVTVLLLLTGCGAMKSMEQLESEAMLSGDWSAVEQRERQIARRNLNSSIHCPAGKIGYCEADLGRKECYCVDQEQLNAFLMR